MDFHALGFHCLHSENCFCYFEFGHALRYKFEINLCAEHNILKELPESLEHRPKRWNF